MLWPAHIDTDDVGRDALHLWDVKGLFETIGGDVDKLDFVVIIPMYWYTEHMEFYDDMIVAMLSTGKHDLKAEKDVPGGRIDHRSDQDYMVFFFSKIDPLEV